MSLEYLLSLECFFNSALIQNISGAFIKPTELFCYSGGPVPSFYLSVHVYVHECYWRPLIGCGEKEGGRATSLYGHRGRREAAGYGDVSWKRWILNSQSARK